MVICSVLGALRRVLSSINSCIARLPQSTGQVDNERCLHVLCEQENRSHKFWLDQFEGGAVMRMQAKLPLVLARALSARDEGFERTLPSRQVVLMKRIIKAPGIR